MGDKRKRSGYRTKARIPPSKRKRVETVNTTETSSPSVSSSSKKLGCVKLDEQYEKETVNDLANGIVNMNLLVSFLQQFPCIKCHGAVEVNIIRLGGLALQLEVVCTKGYCQHLVQQNLSKSISIQPDSTPTTSAAKNDNTSSTPTATGKKSQMYEINKQYLMAINMIGGHESTGTALAGYLNLPPPVLSYHTHMNNLALQASAEAMNSTERAADEVRSVQGNNIRVSVDGTWQRRGFSSKQGVVTVLSNLGCNKSNKVLDTETLSTFCHGCAQTTNDNIKLSTVKSGHDCVRNHEGSAGAMESVGAVNIFSRSKEQYGLQYTEYLGDGDSKAFANVTAAELYDKPITKLECCGHIQKRMGKALMKLVADNKTKPFVVDKNLNHMNSKTVANKSRGEKLYRGLGGIGRLTTKAIKSIQGHYGAAIRSNTDVESMRAAVKAILEHRKGEHTNCPDWCPSHQGNVEAADKHKLPRFVCKLMEPVFNQLSSQDLLERCVHGGTQNANESFHNLIWTFCPKEKFAGGNRIRLAVSLATIIFNDGARGLLPLYARCGVTVGRYTLQYVAEKDSKRVRKAELACVMDNRHKRRARSQNADKESYEAGAF